MIKGSTERADRVSIRSVLRGPDSAAPRASRRRTKALVGWLLYCCTAVGGTAAAFTVRDTLFPSLGGAPAQVAKIWANNVDTTAASEGGAPSTHPGESAVEAITVPATTPTTIASSIDDRTDPSASVADQGPGRSADKGGSGGTGPQTGTTVAGPTPSGPGPGTTVDGHPTDTSTPGSASTPPTSADATSTSASVPDPAATDSGNQNGKGGGSGGGGGSGTTVVP